MSNIWKKFTKAIQDPMTYIDPLNARKTIPESLWGKEPKNEAERQQMEEALKKYQEGVDQFEEGGAPVYANGEALEYAGLDPRTLAQLGPSAMADVSTDPRLAQAQYDALRQLEERSNTGFTARDEADLAQQTARVNRDNRGRMGAIQQNMAARGMSGSGMDLMSQMQASQDATEREALAALEKNAQMQDNKHNAIMGRGQLSGQMRSQDFSEQTAKADRADAVKRFNTSNQVQTQFQNNRGVNDTRQANWGRTNETNDRNTSAKYGYRKDLMDARGGASKVQYNAGAEGANRNTTNYNGNRDWWTNILSSGAKAGAGFMAHGGRVPGQSPFDGLDMTENDIFPAQLSPGEIVIPQSIADDPVASAKFVAAQNAGMDPMASKYVAQNASQKEPKLPFYPTPTGAPIAPSPKFERRTDGGAPKQKPAPIPEPVLAKLAETKPDLVAAYRKKMAEADGEVADAKANAKKARGFDGLGELGMAALASKKTALYNSWDNMGRTPDTIGGQKQEWGNVFGKNAAEDLANAKEKRQGVKESFDDEQKLQQIEKTQRMGQGDSEESKAARDFFGSLMPSLKQNPAFANMSAAQLEKQYPLLMDKWKADREYGLKQRSAKVVEPKLNQSQAASYGKRLLQAEKELKDISATGYNRSDISSGLGSVMPNIVRTDSGVRQDQAERNFLSAVLRRESGASISDTEMKNGEAQYFDRVGDGPETKAQKARNRAQVLESMRAESGPAWAQVGEVENDKEPAPHGQRVKQNGITYEWNGKAYVEAK